MPSIPLTSGAYQSPSVIANAQRAVNVYPETNPKETKPPVPVTHYQRPGKTLLGSPIAPGAGRGLYTASNGDLYAVVNDTVYFINAAWQFFALGNIAAGSTPTSMADNGAHSGNAIVLVDGTPSGYQINMTTRAMTAIVDGTGLFVGADIVQFLETFFLFNYPGTQNWYISLANSVAFNALDIAAKSAYADNIVTIGVRQKEPWLIGLQSTEPWYLAGGADFPFEAQPSTFIPHGCAAKYSLTFSDIALGWISNNLQGDAIIVKSEGYQVKRISNHAIEQEIQKFATIADAIGGTYQVNGHTFMVWHFPTADKTYAYDLATEQWHQLAWTDENGVLHRDRAGFYANAYGVIVGLDWGTGDLYKIDPTVYTDAGDPISFIRGFPHVLDEMRRLTHWALVVDMECGTIEDADADPQLNMRYSDDRGETWSDSLQVPLGRTGVYETSPQFTRLGMARDRVYELYWSENMKTALNAVYLEAEGAES
jgi:hypothetical protein